MLNFRRTITVILIGLVAFGLPSTTHAYSILTHEQLIDILWPEINNLLHQSFPYDTPSCQIADAKRYAYGGALIPDAGYYPRGHAYTSDLTHYVRTGDFVTNLFKNATDACELAFAVGALTHYVGDIYGHSMATNLAVPKMYPKLAKQYGTQAGSNIIPASVLTYEQGKKEHTHVEFAFDIDAINRDRIAPREVRNMVGLDVALQQLTFAFYQTYGLSKDFTLTKNDLNVYAYRNDANGLIPTGAYAVAAKERKKLFPEIESDELKILKEMVAATESNEGWKSHEHGPTTSDNFVAAILTVLPVVSAARDKYPIPETHQWYIASEVTTVLQLRKILNAYQPTKGRFIPQWPAEGNTPAIPLPNRNLDTGSVECPRIYGLADKAYFGLLVKLVDEHEQTLKQNGVPWRIPAPMKADILTYFSDLHPAKPYAFGDERSKNYGVLVADLDKLKGFDTGEECPDTSYKFGNYGQDRYSHERVSQGHDVWIPALCDPPAKTP